MLEKCGFETIVSNSNNSLDKHNIICHTDLEWLSLNYRKERAA